jgi:tRNA(Ile)-lysidine synthase
MTLQKKVRAFVARHALLTVGDSVLVAVSGGPDSVALLHVLNELREELRLRLEVAHLQHGIRGEQAKEDAQFVTDLAQRFNLPLHLKEVNIPGIRHAAGKGNTEQVARDERYRFFARVAEERKLAKIATGHTQDDQAETVLMWLLRGCGRRGLGGMSPRRSLNNGHGSEAVTLIRPLLGVSKAEILDYLREAEISFRTDETNKDAALLRNWIRLELMPEITKKIDHGWPGRVSRQADLLRDEDQLLDRIASAALERLRVSGGLNRAPFLEQEPALQRRILRLWIAENRGNLRGLDYGHVEDLIDLIAHGQPQARLSIPGQWELVNEYNIVKLHKEKRGRRLRSVYSYRLSLGRGVTIPEAGMKFETERSAIAPATGLEKGLMAVFDAGLLPLNLTVRNFRPGDRFQPIGMKGHKKVKDLFIEQKVPLSVRSVLPLLLSGDEILWIPPYARSEIAKIGPQTTEFLYVNAVPLES